VTEQSPQLSIGEVAERTGLAVSAIRYYEKLGLLAPAARSSGRRRFDSTAVTRLRIISTVQQAGFSLDEIHQLLDDGAETTQTRHALVRAKLRDVREDIRRLEAIAHALEQALGCGCNSLEHCSLVNPDAVEGDTPAAASSAGSHR
jgi:MerR family transcriptional regulator, redox-sensitive transcriptional activator SoxR